MLLGDASPWSIAGAVAAVALLWLVAWVLEWAWWTPRRLGRALRAQGLRGTRYRLFTGDVPENARLSREARLQPMPRGSHDITPRVQPMSCNVIKEHGKFFHREIHKFVTSEQAVFVSPSMCFLLEINSSQLSEHLLRLCGLSIHLVMCSEPLIHSMFVIEDKSYMCGILVGMYLADRRLKNYNMNFDYHVTKHPCTKMQGRCPSLGLAQRRG